MWEQGFDMIVSFDIIRGMENFYFLAKQSLLSSNPKHSMKKKPLLLLFKNIKKIPQNRETFAELFIGYLF